MADDRGGAGRPDMQRAEPAVAAPFDGEEHRGERRVIARIVRFSGRNAPGRETPATRARRA